MNIIIPMAGKGSRFVSEGYTDPKPLINVGGRRIIEYVCDMYDKENDNFIFICNEDHLATTDMSSILKGLVTHSEIVSMPPHKLGPVYTVLAAKEFITNNDPYIITYCDTPITWNYDDFKEFIKDKDACVVSHVGFHPHTLSSNVFAYSKTDNDNRILEIKEKSSYTDNRFNEHASSGVYYFKHGCYILNYFQQLMGRKLSHNGEYYVTLVFNLLINEKIDVYSYVNDMVLALGTPNEVRNFEAWQTILGGTQVKNEEELVQCYNYWKDYNK